MLCHLIALSGVIVPFGNILGPLIVWMIGKSDSEFVNEHGKSSLNFQISFTLFFIASVVLILFIGPIAIVMSGRQRAVRRGDGHRQRREGPQRRGRPVRGHHHVPELIRSAGRSAAGTSRRGSSHSTSTTARPCRNGRYGSPATRNAPSPRCVSRLAPMKRAASSIEAVGGDRVHPDHDQGEGPAAVAAARRST